MRSIQEIKNGMKSANQDDWITFDELEWIIEQAEKYQKIRDKMLKHSIEKNYEALKRLDD